MKKILSALLVVAMIASMFAVFSIPTAAAEGGMFDTHGRVDHQMDDFDGDKNSVPGYKYTDDGFHMTGADWSTGTPFSHMSTAEKVNLKQGVYMKVRVDKFEYAAKDKWIGMNIWSLDSIAEGSGDPKFGYGIQTLMRYSNGFANIAWHKAKYASTPSGGYSTMDDAGKELANAKDADGNPLPVFVLQITWDGSSYNVDINGAKAPQAVVDYMNETYAEDSYAYIGFTMYNDTMGGTQEATILEWGTSASEKDVPYGNYEKDSEDNPIVFGDIIDASEVAEGDPAIMMSGDKEYSDLKGTPTSTIGAEISITDDLLVRVVAQNTLADAGIWNVDNDSSYDIVDFPVFMVMTKNLCTCATGGKCYGYEEAGVYIATDKDLVPNSTNKVTGLSVYDKCFNVDGDGYVFFIYDLSNNVKTDENPDGKFSGRINSTRVDFSNIDLKTPGANEFDVVMQCFFASEEDAVNYAMNYLEDIGYDPSNDTGDSGDQTTDAKGEETTEAPDQDTTEAPDQDTTEAPADDITEAPAQTNDDTADDDTSSSCFGTIGFGAIAIVAAVAGAGYVTFKKKD